MQPAVQAGRPGASACPAGGHDSSKQQHKSEAEHTPNTAYSSSGKSKNRERSTNSHSHSHSHQSVDSWERERCVKGDEMDSNSKRAKRERNSSSGNSRNKVEEQLTNFVDENGGLLSCAGVDRLYNLMSQYEQRSSPVACRTWLAGVIVATEREECLNKFARLGGLGLLDDWLQEAHKGKVGGDGAKEASEESIDDLLLGLLRALEKLPIDCDSLKSCNVWKSINNLRSHKNSEIGKKARKLVDTWKRKVDSEWKEEGETTKNSPLQGICGPSRPISSNDSSHFFKSNGGSVEGTAKSSARTAKVTGNNNSSSSTGEIVIKTVPLSPGKNPSAFASNPVGINETPSSHAQEGSSSLAEVCNASIPDERSSNSQPPSSDIIYSNGHTTSPVTNTKTGSNSMSHISAKGFKGTGMNGTCKDSGLGKPLVWSKGIDKSSSMSVNSDKSQNDLEKIETSSDQRLIATLPNLGRICVSNVLVEEPTKRSSPPDKHTTLALDSFDEKSRLQSSCCIEDRRMAVNFKSGLTTGLERVNEELNRQCITGGEADCQSSESQLSFCSAPQCCTARLKKTRPYGQAQVMDDLQVMVKHKSERCNGQTTDAESISICLLACVAEDESSGSGKKIASAAPVKDKNWRDSEPTDRANASAHSIKQRQNSSNMQVQPDADALNSQECAGGQKRVSSCGVHNSEIAAASVKGQSGENIRPVEGFSEEHRSPKTVLKGTTLHQNDGSFAHSRNELLSSSSCKSHEEDSAKEQELKIDPCRGYTSQGDTGSRNTLDDKKHVFHHSSKNNVFALTMAGSGRYVSSVDENECTNEEDYESKTTSESWFKVPGEDALEVAVQVAKEVEQKYGKTAHKKENPETNMSLEDIVIPKDNMASQAAKECKQKIVDYSKETNMHAQLDRNSSQVNSITGKAAGSAERCDCQPAEDDLHHESLSSSKPSKNMIFKRVSSPEIVTGPNSSRSRTATPEQTAEVQSSTDIDTPERRDFDLNEGIMLDEGLQEPDAVYCPISPVPNISVVSHSVVSSSLSTPIAVVASTKGAFVPPVSPFKGKSELGWRGSAATSAFRPAEPRRTPHSCQPPTETDGRLADKNPHRCQATTQTDFAAASATKIARPYLDIDLNVADEGLFQEEMASSAKLVTQSSSLPTPCNRQSGVVLDFDLNRADASEENGPFLAFDRTKTDVAAISGRKNGSGGTKPIKHDFDLNDGLRMDDAVAVDDSNASNGKVQILGSQAPQLTGIKMGGEILNLGPWSHTGGVIPAIAMPAFPSMRPETAFPVAVPQTFFSMGQVQGIPSFHADVFRPPAVFSSSTTAAFSYPAQTPVFPYSSYPFGFNSACFPPPSPSFLDSSGSHTFPLGASQILTSGAIISSHVRPPYLTGLTKITAPSNNDRNWSRPSLDLNAGPESVEAETKEERVGMRQATGFEGPRLMDQQTRVFCQPAISADSLKRKEPEGGWDLYRSVQKQETRR